MSVFCRYLFAISEAMRLKSTSPLTAFWANVTRIVQDLDSTQLGGFPKHPYMIPQLS